MWFLNLASGYTLLASPLFLTTTRAQTAYQSIYKVDAFAEQPICVQNCFTVGYDNIQCYTDVLGSFLGCPNTPCATAFAAVDSCYCRGDLQAAANEILGMCINELCSVGDNSVNLATAVSMYSNYCQERGFSVAPASTTATTTTKGKSGTAATTIQGVQPVTDPTSPTSVSTSGTATSSATSGNNTLIIASASVGALLVVGMLVVAVYYWRRWRSQRRRSSVRDRDEMESIESRISRLLNKTGTTTVFHHGRASSPTLTEPTFIGSDAGIMQRALAE